MGYSYNHQPLDDCVVSLVESSAGLASLVYATMLPPQQVLVGNLVVWVSQWLGPYGIRLDAALSHVLGGNRTWGLRQTSMACGPEILKKVWVLESWPPRND